MAQVYVNLIYVGKRTWNQIPLRLKEEVKSILKNDVESGLITSEYYTEITGESC